MKGIVDTTNPIDIEISQEMVGVFLATEKTHVTIVMIEKRIIDVLNRIDIGIFPAIVEVFLATEEIHATIVTIETEIVDVIKQIGIEIPQGIAGVFLAIKRIRITIVTIDEGMIAKGTEREIIGVGIAARPETVFVGRIPHIHAESQQRSLEFKWTKNAEKRDQHLAIVRALRDADRLILSQKTRHASR